MRVIIEGFDLPGRTACVQGGGVVNNVHVGVQVRNEPEQLVAADADAAHWHLNVEVLTAADGGHDFRGPAVHGKRGDRFLYLTWGDVDLTSAVDGAGSFTMFIRAKLMLNRIDAHLIGEADRDGHQLVGRIKLTDDLRLPRCARVDPPDLTWTVQPPLRGRFRGSSLTTDLMTDRNSERRRD